MHSKWSYFWEGLHQAFTKASFPGNFTSTYSPYIFPKTFEEHVVPKNNTNQRTGKKRRTDRRTDERRDRQTDRHGNRNRATSEKEDVRYLLITWCKATEGHFVNCKTHRISVLFQRMNLFFPKKSPLVNYDELIRLPQALVNVPCITM